MTRSSSVLSLTIVILLAALTRLLPHWPNFTPVMAMALVGGLYASNKRVSMALPILVMMLSDLLLGLTSGWAYSFHDTQIWVYLSMLAITGLGVLLSTKKNYSAILIGGTLAGLLFFVVTNAAVWFTGSMYPHSFDGLLASYAAGLAFYKGGGNYLLNGIVSTWVYGAAMLALLHLVEHRKERLA